LVVEPPNRPVRCWRYDYPAGASIDYANCSTKSSFDTSRVVFHVGWVRRLPFLLLEKFSLRIDLSQLCAAAALQTY
jgi:hypothetical protein